MSEILVNQLKTAAGQSTLQFDSTGDVLLSTGRLGRVGGSTIEIDSDGQFVGTNAFTGAVTIGDGLTVDNDGATVATFDRATSAGTIVDLHKDGSSMGTLSTDGGGIEVKSSDNLTFYNGNSQQLRWGTGNQLYPITDDASDLGRSTGRWQDLYLSGGVYLGGTGAANYLDDYEEGTFTPQVSNGSGGTMTASTKVGLYRKIGNLVYVSITITGITKSGSGPLEVNSLPFAIASANLSGYPTGIVRWDDITTSGIMLPYFEVNTTKLEFQNFSSSGYTGGVTISNCSSSFQLYNIIGSYITSS
jgi:hypothetical protein